MPIEVEARFRGAGPEPLAALARMASLGPAELGPATTSAEVDVYLDTVDGALSAARWACRLRARDARVTLSLKGPPDQGTGGWLHRRPEVEGPATEDRDPAAWPPSAAREVLERLTGGAPLLERFTLRQQRVEREVSLGPQRIGTLSLDTVDVEHEAATIGSLHVVELELTAGSQDEAILDPLARAIGSIPGLVPEPRTKLERARSLIEGR
jgi:inorganic triphosphatase YgiF